MGEILNKTAYEWDVTVTSFEVDMFDRLKVSALMKYQQEIGERHLNVFGTTTEGMRREQNLSFIFTKMNIRINRLPRSEERITVRTWCSELRGVRFTRNYVLFDQDGNVLTSAKAEVTTLDLNTRKIVRPTAILGFDDFLYNDELENLAEYPEKIAPPQTVDSTVLREVRFSDIDYNGHVNNTVYADIVFDCLPLNLLKDSVKGFEINFVNEVLPNETLNLSVANSDGSFVVSGAVGDCQSFTARVKL